MPELKQHLPKLSRHSKGQGFIKIDGRQVYLGHYGVPLTQERYDRLVAEWLINGRALPLTETHVLPQILRKLYGSTEVHLFGPKRLRAVRQAMVKKNWAKTHINKQISRICPPRKCEP